jgi:hypothetical protein
MPKTSLADFVTTSEHLLVTVKANQEDLQHLEPYSVQFGAELEGVKAASVKQATLQAEVQQATRDLEGFVTRAQDLAVRLRTGIRSRYGLRAEKLTEFGMRPLRRRKAAKEKKPTEGGEKPAPQGAATTDRQV